MKYIWPFLSSLVLASCLNWASAQVVNKEQPKRGYVVVDTDDTCHFTLDGTDEGLISATTPKKLEVSTGQHILKCVIEKIPDLVWRKIIDVKGSDQVAAIITLKALHLQYDEAQKQSDDARKQSESASQALAAQQTKTEGASQFWCFAKDSGSFFYSDVFESTSGKPTIEDGFKQYLQKRYSRALTPSCYREATKETAESNLETTMGAYRVVGDQIISTGWKYGSMSTVTNSGGNSVVAPAPPTQQSAQGSTLEGAPRQARIKCGRYDDGRAFFNDDTMKSFIGYVQCGESVEVIGSSSLTGGYRIRRNNGQVGYVNHDAVGSDTSN